MVTVLRTIISIIPVNIDPRIYKLEEQIETYETVMLIMGIIIFLLAVIVILLRHLMKVKEGKGGKISKKVFRKAAAQQKAQPAAGQQARAKAATRDLPDPGIIFKYSLSKEEITDKTITIGQTEGSIKTFSTEILNDHLTVYIRKVENRRDRDIYDLPDEIREEYQIDLRRDGKVVMYHPELTGWTEMGSRERIHLKQEPDPAGEATYLSLPAQNPIRFRLGDRLNQDGKFVNGFFEFHLFTKEEKTQTKAGISKIEQNFMIRLYKIYPGYDTGAVNEDGLYPMIDPFKTR